MAKIATCPKCAKQLGLPATIGATDRAECPECHAIFSLCETVQISLPVVRVLDPAEQPVAASLSTDGLQPTPVKKEDVKKEISKKENVSAALTSNSAPLKSWEERLKNALALDNSDDEVVSKSNIAKAETVVPKNDQRNIPGTSPSRSPSFEFELDPTPAASTEPKTAEPKTVKKTAKPKQVVLNPELPVPAPKRTSSPSKALADFTKGELASAGGTAASLTALTTKLPKAVLPEETKHAVAEVAEVAVQAVSRRRTTRSGFPKIAALGTGAAVGIFGGLYGLLWLQGSEADYLGLVNVLPASMLPTSMLPGGGMAGGGMPNSGGEGVGGAPPAEASSPEVVVSVEGTPKNEEVERDEAVRLASAVQRLPDVASSVRIDAKEFSDLVDAAAVALPEFIAGDLSNSGSIQRKGQAYMALCRLAEHFDFANQQGLAPPIQAKAKQAAQLFGQVTFKANVREDLAHIAGRWWEYQKRPSDGIFLAGYVQKTQPAGSRTLCWVKLSKQSMVAAIPVLLDQQRYQTGDQIGVVGSVVSNSSELPPGFSGQQVVGAEYVFALQMGR